MEVNFTPQGIAEQRVLSDRANQRLYSDEQERAQSTIVCVAYDAALDEIERLQANNDEKAQKWFAISLRTNGRYQAVRKRERLLQHDNAALRAQVDSLTRERDAAVLMVPHTCETCAWQVESERYCDEPCPHCDVCLKPNYANSVYCSGSEWTMRGL